MGVKPRLVNTLVVLLSVILAALGSLFGNLVTDSLVGILPSSWKAQALLLFWVVTLAAVAVGIGYSWLQRTMGERDPRRRSTVRQRAAVVLIVVDAALAAVDGVLSNTATGSLPAELKPIALPLFVAVIGGAIAASVLLFSWEQAPQVVAATNRKNFLTKLHSRYIKRQEDALRGSVLIALGLQEEPEVVGRTTLGAGSLGAGGVLVDTELLPAGAGIREAYQEAQGQLLILGAPGAGKTTLLLELALDLLRQARAEREKALPMPVVCNLSTWAINGRSLDEWLVEDLMETYQVPRAVARVWVASEEVLPLLDGLDEVETTQHAACVKTINAFREAHPQLPLVVCSRLEEYRAQGVPLAVQRAVVAQPLTDEKIQAYLAFGGEGLTALRAAVETDTALRQVLRTPLLLRIVVLTYEGLPPESIPPVGDHDAWVQQVFGEYVGRMLRRRRRLEVPLAGSSEEVDQPEYSPEDAEKYLAWLAGQMRVHGRVELYLEQLQEDLWSNAMTRLSYRIASGLLEGLLFGLLVWLLAGPLFGLVVWLVVVLVVGLSSLYFTQALAIPLVHWLLVVLLGGLIFGLVAGLVAGLLYGLLYGLSFGLVDGLLFGLINGRLSVLFFELFAKQVDERDYRTPNERIRRALLFHVIIVLAGILGIELVVGLPTGLVVGLRFGLSGGLATGLVAGLVAGLSGGLLYGLLYGGARELDYAIVRWDLQRKGLVPSHIARFLNYAADHVLLQSVGGGYRFVHILLRDYFADLGLQEPGTDGKA